MRNLISVKNLCKEYNNEGVITKALCGVSFDIADGEFVAIMGPSGSGKSTLMQLLGFLDRPTDGKYFFQGKDTQNFSDDDLAYLRNQKIGFVFQSFNLLPRTTVFENVQLPLLYDERKESRSLIEKKVHEALRAVNLEHRINNFSNQLSGGEQQMLATARGLMSSPSILLMDEPSMGLAPVLVDQIFEVIKELNAKGTTILLVEQNALMALSIAHRAYVLQTGSIVLSGTASDVAKDENVRKAYLGI